MDNREEDLVSRLVNENYNMTGMNVEEMMSSLGDPEKIGFVKEVLEKIG